MTINISLDKRANVFTMLKWINIMRTGNLKITRDAVFDFRPLLTEIRNLIIGANVVAARVLKKL